VPADPKPTDLPSITDMFPVSPRTAKGPGPLYVHVDTIYGPDDQGYFVWKVIEPDQRPDPSADLVFELKKVYVEPGDEILDIGGLFRYRELINSEELIDAKELAPDSLTAVDVPEGFKDGDKAVFHHERWLFRPGDLVEVLLGVQGGGDGFYVPMKAIRMEGNKHFVFVVDRPKPEQAVAKRVEIRLVGAVGEWQRIEPAKEDALKEGTQVILGGTHFLHEGQPVTVAKQEELHP